MSEKRKIFVSYSRADKDKVFPLVKNLEKNVGTKFWIDLDGIESTAQFEDVIVRAIMQCDIILFMLSDNSTNGKWTQREVFFAEKLGKRIVPIIIDGGESKGWAAFHFANINYVDAKNKYQLEKLSHEIVDWLGHESVVEPSDSKPNPPKPRTIAVKQIMSRLAAPLKNILLVIAALIVIFFIIGIYLGDEDEDEEEVPKVVQLEEVELTPSGRINGHDYVDLGLSVMWATYNVGASSPEQSGDYFAWGETRPKTSYDRDNSWTLGMELGDISGDAEYDAATVKWGGTWRMPTKDDFKELIDSCQWTWTTLNGVNGYKISGKRNGNSIFLPAAGGYNGLTLYYEGESGGYWSSTPHSDLTSDSFHLNFRCDKLIVSLCHRIAGRPVRPVSISYHKKSVYKDER